MSNSADVKQRHNKRKRPLTDDQKLALIGRLRIGDLNTLFQYRYRSTVYPDDDDGRHSLSIILHHYARNNPMKVPKIIKAHAPWMPQDEIDELLQAIADKPKSWHAKTLGIELNFTPSEWRELRLRTIAPVNMTKEERRQDARLRNRGRMRAKRRFEEQRMPRIKYEVSSKTKTQPWKAAGMSRRTWYRHGQPSVAQVCSNKDREYNAHTCANRGAAKKEGGAARLVLPSRPSGSTQSTKKDARSGQNGYVVPTKRGSEKRLLSVEHCRSTRAEGEAPQ
jgi:hypothetical protein